MGNPIVHFEIRGKDSRRLNEFYAKIFGWKIDSNNPMNYGLVSTQSDKGIGGGITDADEQNPPGVMIYIEVNDPQQILNAIEKSGGKTVVPVTVIPDMVTLAAFEDPGGNVIGLVKEEAQA